MRSLTLVNALFARKKTRGSLVQSVSDEAYASVLHYAHSRTAYGETEFAATSRSLEGAEDLRQNKASFHARCRKGLVNSVMLKRAEARFEKAAASQSFHVLLEGRPLHRRQAPLYPPLSVI